VSADGVVGPVPAGRDPDAYDRLRRRVLWSLPTGLYVIGSAAHLDGRRRWNLMTANLVVQVAVEPKMVAVAVAVDALTCRLIAAGGSFSVSLLHRADRAVVRRFVKPVPDVELDPEGRPVTMGGVPVRSAPSGCPVLAGSAAWLDCEVRHDLGLGSHVLFAGEVVDVWGPEEGGARGEVLRMEDTRMNYGG
jgi:flavin reductase (DIM6/NTAB) family NADH-FMN oxidoreductase RutF